MDNKERGAASIFVELSGGVITVKHGTDSLLGETDKAILAQWTANPGDWDKLWDRINELKSKEATK